jgi:surface protein
MSNMFTNSGLSTANYDATLIGWSTITATETALQPNVNFNAGTSKYCNGASARNILTSAPNNWTITDAGLDCSVLPKVVLDSNNVTLKYSGTTIPSPYLIQADPRGTGMEWFAIVNNSTKNNITNYAKGFQSGRTYFTPPGSSTPIPFSNIVTTLVTDMSLMFNNANSFNQNIGSWDVSNVTNMEDMISDAPAFNQPIGSWNMSQVTSMSRMFVGASTFNQNIKSWNVSKVTNMSYMFYYAKAFNQPIDSWNVSNVTDMSGMFDVASSFNQPIGSWNVSKVTDMSDMFNNSGLSTANYDATLIGWSTITATETALQPNVTFSAGTSKYCNGASARGILTSAPNNWTITDSGLDCTSLGTEEFEAISYKLYPNPVVSVLNVKIDSKLINQTYFILDTLGRSVLNGQLNEVDTAINVAQLSKGIYYIKVADNNSSKFIKL